MTCVRTWWPASVCADAWLVGGTRGAAALAVWGRGERPGWRGARGRGAAGLGGGGVPGGAWRRFRRVWDRFWAAAAHHDKTSNSSVGAGTPL